MKAVILAGGFGTRLSEETYLKPKPMVEIGGKPILWHIMKTYSSFGINEFIICLGYKGYIIKEYFSNYFLHMSDVHINLSTNDLSFEQMKAEPWKISLIDTGENSMTGGRIKRIEKFVTQEESFFLTYGDGLSDIDINQSLQSHIQSKKKATITCVKPPSRFGAVELKDNKITEFIEKPKSQGGYINGGFFVLSPAIFDYISGDDSSWETEVLKNLAFDGELNPFVHNGYWQPMDTLRDKISIENLWNSGNAPWKVW